MMQYKKKLKLDSFINLFNNLLHRNKLIVFLGNDYLLIITIKNQQIIDSIEIQNDAKNLFLLYQQFLNKYKKYYVTFLLGDVDCKLRQEVMPIVGPILKKNPVDNFIIKRFSPDIITAYNIYKIANIEDETWYSSIASRHVSVILQKMLQYIFDNSFKYQGTYFLSLEFENIISLFFSKKKNKKPFNDLEIFVTITKASGIFVVAKYKKQILEVKLVPYPDGKSVLYVQGTIEQAVNDLLIKNKNFVKQNHLDILIITLSNSEMQDLLSESSFKESGFTNYRVVAFHPNDIKLVKKRNDDYFQDYNLIRIFTTTKNYVAFNASIRTITKLSLLNNIIFKPLFGLIILSFMGLLLIKYNNFEFNREIVAINKDYYSLSKEYREIGEKYPELGNPNDLIELYNLQKLINKETISPFSIIKKIYNPNFPFVKIKNFTWQKIKTSSNIIDKHQLKIIINYEYKIEKSFYDKITYSNLNYFHWLKSKFADYQLTYQQNQQDIKYIAQKTIIPVQVVINIPLEEK